MITLRETIQVDRPVAEVYDYLANLENVQKWQPSVVEVKRLTEGPTRVGSRFREVAKVLGRRSQTVCEVTQLEPNRTIALRATSDGPIEYETMYTFDSAGASTQMHIVGSFRTKGLWRLLEPILKAEVQKESRHELVAMKASIEARPL